MRERGVGDARDPEVGDLAAGLRQDHVLGLDVAVEDAGVVRDAEPGPELEGEASDLGGGIRPSAIRCLSVSPSTYSNTR